MIEGKIGSLINESGSEVYMSCTNNLHVRSKGQITGPKLASSLEELYVLRDHLELLIKQEKDRLRSELEERLSSAGSKS